MKLEKHLENQYDLILIGSGQGALTVASLMAQLRNKKVLVLERHFKAGGFTHDFKRQEFHWDVGIHYVGQMGEGSQMRRLFDLITGRGVQWQKMPEIFEKFVYPGLTFKVYSDKKRYIEDLIKLFPEEQQAIKKYFRDVTKANQSYLWHSLRQNGSFFLKLLGYLFGLWNPAKLDVTTKNYLDQNFKIEQLKSLLASQWGDYGLPPSLTPFACHAIIVNHYLEGGYYPIGGAGKIAESVKKIVEEHGGRFLLNREVTEVLVEGGKAVGVKVRKVNAKQEDSVEEYYAPTIISNAGAVTTYLKLIPPQVSIPFRDSLQRFVEQYPPATNITLYLGLKDDPRKLGFQGENHWIYEQFNHDEIYAKRGESVREAKPIQAYLSFPSLKDPKAKAHTAEIITWTDYDVFTQWREQPWRHRSDDYQALKQRLTEALIDLVNHHYPGFKDLVEYKELSTPITNEHFTGHHKGGVYGISIVPQRFKQENLVWTRAKTPLPGLYLTGADIFMGGIVSAMISGVVTLSCIPDGIGFPEVFATATSANKVDKVLS
jgi:all-trans-retinol 13,14-reductase